MLLEVLTAVSLLTLQDVHPEYSWRVLLRGSAVLAAYLAPRPYRRHALALNIALCLHRPHGLQPLFGLLLWSLPRDVADPHWLWLLLFDLTLTAWYLQSPGPSALLPQSLLVLWGASWWHAMTGGSWYGARFASLCGLVVFDRFVRPPTGDVAAQSYF